MQLGRIIPIVNQTRFLFKHRSFIHPLETSKGIFFTTKDMEGNIVYEYYVNLIDLFDNVMIQDSTHFLSIEQQNLLDLFFKQADTLSGLIEGSEDYINAYSLMDRHIQTLDDFLGSYIGVDSGKFSRYGQEQFHSQRQPFSQTIESVTRT